MVVELCSLRIPDVVKLTRFFSMAEGGATYIPDNLQHKLWHHDRVRLGTGPVRIDVAIRVRHMAPVVRRVERFAIPAGGKGVDGPDAALAEPGRHVQPVGRRAIQVSRIPRLGHAPMADLLLLAGAFVEHDIPDQHAEARLERRDPRHAVIRRDVIHGDAALSGQALVGELGHSLVRPVTGLEVHDGGPVVGQVIGKGAAGASGRVDEVVGRKVHRRLERVASDDLVEMGRRHGAGANEGVKAVDDELRALEPEHGRDTRRRRDSPRRRCPLANGLL